MTVLTIRIQGELQRQKAISFFKKNNIDILQEEETIDVPSNGKPFTENELENHLEESAKGEYISFETFKKELKSWN